LSIRQSTAASNYTHAQSGIQTKKKGHVSLSKW
jgi:hypothetical protein